MKDILDMSVDEFEPESQHDYDELAQAGTFDGMTKEQIYYYYMEKISDERDRQEMDQIIHDEDEEEENRLDD
jgi:hypothetical protein